MKDRANPFLYRAFWPCLLLAFLFVVGISQSESQAASGSAIEAFKARLGAPQPIYLEIEFDAIVTDKKHEPLITSFKMGDKTSYAISHANEHLTALLQTNGFAIARTPLHFKLKSLDDKAVEFSLHFGCGYYFNRAWWMESTNQIIYYQKEDSSTNGLNWIVTSIQNYESLVEQVFRLGISDLIPESLVWNGETFTAVTKNSKTLKGMLTIDVNVAQPTRVDYEIFSSEGRVLAGYSVAYGYDTSHGADRLPKTIKRTTVKNTNPGPYDTDREFVISSTLTKPTPSDEVAFFPNSNLFAVEPLVTYWTNNTTYLYSGGKLSPVGMVPNILTTFKDRRKYVILLLVVTSTFFASWLAIKHKQQKTKN